MSALGHKRTLRDVRFMSALPQKRTSIERVGDVRFVPKTDIPLFDDLVGGKQKFRRDRQA